MIYDALICGVKHLDCFNRNRNKSQATTETGSGVFFEGSGGKWNYVRIDSIISIFIAFRRDSKTMSCELSQRHFTIQSIQGHVQHLSTRYEKKGLGRSRSFLSAGLWRTADISYFQAQAGVTPLNPEKVVRLPSPVAGD